MTPYSDIDFGLCLLPDGTKTITCTNVDLPHQWGPGAISREVSQPAITNISLKMTYRQTSNITHPLAGNKTINHSDVVGASPVGAAPTTSSFLTLTPGFNGLSRDSDKTRRESFQFLDLVRLILEIWRHLNFGNETNLPEPNSRA